MGQNYSFQSLIVSDEYELTPSGAVAAIITVDGNYLLQLRDSIPGIFYPDHWGLFGGGMEAGESECDALLRELREELCLTVQPDEIQRFSAMFFDFSFAGGPRQIVRAFYELNLSSHRLHGLEVLEGQGMRTASASDVLDAGMRIAPYDAFALWMHINRKRIAFPEGPTV